MMVTLWFKPGDAKTLKLVKAIKDSAHISLRDAKDAVEIQRVTCDKKYREAVIEAIEAVGGLIE